MLVLTPYVLVISGGMILYSLSKEKKPNVIPWCIAAYIITFLSEVIGVSTGLLFGDYIYGDTLGLKIFGVPFIIGINWVLIIAGASGIAARFIKSSKAVPVAAAGIAVIFDYILEPAAVKLNYWQWENNVIPLYNYISWFVLAYLVSLVQVKMNAVPDDDVPQFYLGIQAVFFMILNFV